MSGGAGENPFASPMAPQGLSAEDETEIVAEGKLEVDDIDHALRSVHSYWPSPIVWTVLVIALLIGMLGVRESILIPLLAISVPVVVYVPYVIYFRRSAYKSAAWQLLFQRVGEQPQRQRIRFTTHYVEIDSPSFDAILPWNRVINVIKIDRQLILVSDTSFLVPIPEHFFESEADFRAASSFAYRQHMDYARRNLRLLIPEDAVPALLADDLPVGAVAGHGQPTWPECYAAYTRLMRPKPGTWLQLGSLMLAAGCTTGMLQLSQSPLYGLLYVLLTLSGISAVIVAIRSYCAIATQFRRQSAGDDMHWTITAKELRCTTNNVATTFPWTFVSQIDGRKDCLFLVFQRFYVTSIAKRYFASEEDWRQVVEWASDTHQRLRDR